METLTARPTSTPVHALPPGSRVGPYEIVGVIEAGRHGIVYTASDRAGAGRLAIKEFMPADLVQRRGSAVTPRSARDAVLFADGQRHFLRQAQDLLRVCHPSLAAPLRCWEQNGTAYMALPLYRGQMMSRVAESALAHPSQAWVEHFVRPLLDLLSTLHRRRLFGVDLSPSNILLVDDKFPIVMRLGPPWNPQACGALPAVVRQRAWQDIQALAQLIQPFVSASRAYPDSLLNAIAGAASGQPGRRSNDVNAFMDALGCHERRRRVRSVAESVLSRAARMQATARPSAAQAEGATEPAAVTAPVTAPAPPAQVAGPVAVGAPAPPSTTSRDVPPRRWGVLGGAAVLIAAAAWFLVTQDGAEPTPAPPTAPGTVVPSGRGDAVEAPPAGTAAVDPSARTATLALPASVAPRLDAPLPAVAPDTGRTLDAQAAPPQRPRAAPTASTRSPVDPRCSDLLARVSLGQPLNAADAALQERLCR